MQIDMNKHYRTRDGFPVRILCIDKKGDPYPVVALVLYPKGNEETNIYTLSGSFMNLSQADSRDLIEVSPYEDFKVDEPVMVRDNATERWMRRHFAGVNLEGRALSWIDGLTSFTTFNRLAWNECRRPTPEELASTPSIV